MTFSFLGRAHRPGTARVVFVSGEPDTPGHHYRVENVASALSGFETAVINIDELGRRFDELARVALLWIWRAPYSRAVKRAMDTARAGGARVVFDIDDLLFRPELDRAGVIAGNRRLGFARRFAAQLQYRNLQRTLLAADHCTAPTEPLAREMRRLGKPATVIPNGFDADFFHAARAADAARGVGGEGLVRIGYAAGTQTHQRDLAVAVPALARVLREHPEVRFVCFQGAIELEEFHELTELSPQLEVRPLVPLRELPREYGRFDINIAPLEVGNPFCEAKSELKYFEAALAGAVTVASPTEPFTAAIEHGITGFLATSEAWYEYLTALSMDVHLRERIARRACSEVSRKYGPEERALLLGHFVCAQLLG